MNCALPFGAIGQITPGPVFTTATFIGSILGGTPAALVATATNISATRGLRSANFTTLPMVRDSFSTEMTTVTLAL